MNEWSFQDGSGQRYFTQATLRVLLFRLAEHDYAVPTAQIEEILRPEELSTLNQMPDYMIGTVQRHHRTIPIIDTRVRMNMPPLSIGLESCVLIAKLPTGLVGFLVDRIHEIVEIKTFDVEIPPDLLVPGARRYIHGVAYRNNHPILLIDLEQMLSHQELADIESTADLDAYVSLPTEERFAHTLFRGEIDDHELPNHLRRQKSSTRMRRLLVFQLHTELFGIPIQSMSEISQIRWIIPVPNAPPEIKGLINLRGVAVPIVDLRHKFGLPQSPPGEETRLVIVKRRDEPIGLWADRVIGIQRVSEQAFQQAPLAIAQMPVEWFKQIARINEQLIVELNLDNLLRIA